MGHGVVMISVTARKAEESKHSKNQIENARTCQERFATILPRSHAALARVDASHFGEDASRARLALQKNRKAIAPNPGLISEGFIADFQNQVRVTLLPTIRTSACAHSFLR